MTKNKQKRARGGRGRASGSREQQGQPTKWAGIKTVVHLWICNEGRKVNQWSNSTECKTWVGQKDQARLSSSKTIAEVGVKWNSENWKSPKKFCEGGANPEGGSQKMPEHCKLRNRALQESGRERTINTTKEVGKKRDTQKEEYKSRKSLCQARRDCDNGKGVRVHLWGKGGNLRRKNSSKATKTNSKPTRETATPFARGAAGIENTKKQVKMRKRPESCLRSDMNTRKVDGTMLKKP